MSREKHGAICISYTSMVLEVKDGNDECTRP